MIVGRDIRLGNRYKRKGDHIMTAIEIGQELSRYEPAIMLAACEEEAEAREEEGEKADLLHRCSAPTINESGIRLQRCGGGRRVIRKSMWS